jgi:hypothetical protein
MKSYFVLGAAVVVGAAAACGGSTSDGGLSSSGSSSGSTSSGGTSSGGTSSGGTDDAGGSSSSGSDPLNAAATCTSNATWTRGTRGSANMQPGVACINCHDTSGGPPFVIAGTVYPSGHEPDLCNGVSGGYTVVITDKAGKVFKAPVNSVGNFYLSTFQATVSMPYTAKVVDNTTGAERAMSTPQSSGDCNSCHTQDGANSAPGRITAPAP